MMKDMGNEFEIIDIRAREILDSRGNPTIEVDVFTRKSYGRGVSPSGASTGKKEAIELRDGNERYFGKGVKNAIRRVEKIKKALKGMDVREQEKIDSILCEMAGEQKKKLGGNTTTAVSLAVCSAAANAKNMPIYKYLSSGEFILPVPYMNLINGGKHAGSGLAIQEFMIVPKNFKRFSDALRAGAEIYHELGKILMAKYGQNAKNVGDEGGYAPEIKSTEEALKILS
ncbi:MAG: phosphopyruvate hydratase, partial [Candidatus Micrarchaeota archaeon]|nr:phosphopyruvate hydratase [Candidatus Micrarchaeota archaeon]